MFPILAILLVVYVLCALIWSAARSARFHSLVHHARRAYAHREHTIGVELANGFPERGVLKPWTINITIGRLRAFLWPWFRPFGVVGIEPIYRGNTPPRPEWLFVVQFRCLKPCMLWVAAQVAHMRMSNLSWAEKRVILDYRLHFIRFMDPL